MFKGTSLFAQIVGAIPRSAFDAAVRKFGGNRCSKGFACWDQLVSMVFCHLGQAKSLREITGVLSTCTGKLQHIGVAAAPRRSTLAYANEHRDYRIYETTFYALLDLCRAQCQHGGRMFRMKRKLYSIDATVIDLCLSIFDWAHFRRAKGAVKLSCVLDHDGYLPVFAHLTAGNVNETRVLKQQILRGMHFPAGSVVVYDRGYNDFGLIEYWHHEDITVVTRMKEATNYQMVQERLVPAAGPVRQDAIIRLTGVVAQQRDLPSMRRIVVWDESQQREIVLLTNNLCLAASTIGAIYKERWQIEIFFKTLKQHLRVKTFVGTTANAVKVQIWTALIAVLLLKYLRARATFPWSIANLVALLRHNLFSYRDLQTWLNAPFETPPAVPAIEQLVLAL